jgi:Carboxypeptidase regulatory-like domain
MHTEPHAFFNRLRIAPKLLGFGVLSLLLFALPALSFGQGATATITGIVTDPQGAVVPGAIVTISSSALNLKRQTTTNSEGHYTIAQLPPAAYSVRVEASEFTVVEINNFILQVGQQATQNISLSVKGGNEIMAIESGGQSLIN